MWIWILTSEKQGYYNNNMAFLYQIVILFYNRICAVTLYLDLSQKTPIWKNAYLRLRLSQNNAFLKKYLLIVNNIISLEFLKLSLGYYLFVDVCFLKVHFKCIIVTVILYSVNKSGMGGGLFVHNNIDRILPTFAYEVFTFVMKETLP